MSMLAKSPLAKPGIASGPPAGSSSPSVDEPVVLIRVRDMNAPVSAGESAAESVVAASEMASPPEASNQVVAPAYQADIPQPNETPLATPVVELPPAEAPQATPAESSVDAAPPTEANPPTPARRSRQRRETPPAKRDWSHTLWQGTVGVLLVAMFVIVYFIMVGGSKKDNTAGPATLQDNHPAPDELESPEISIPSASEGTLEPRESPTAETEFKSAESETSNPDYPVTELNTDAASETGTGEFTSSQATDNNDFEPGSIPQESARPSGDASSFPVTPAQATYPATDPGRFRYPDDSRPNGPAGFQPGAARQTSRPTPPPSRWIERERLGGGPPGGEFQPSTKMR